MVKQGTRLYINITNKCNTNCPFCCMYSNTDKNTFMSFDIFKNIVDKCNTEFELQLEGGEPLLHKDLYLFIEYAISTTKCKKIIILTNSIILDNHIKRLIDISKFYNILVEIKISVNYWLIKNNPNHLQKISNWIFSTEFIPTFNIILNVRKRKEDSWIDDELEKLSLSEHANSYYLQSYGLLTDTDYSKPVIVQNIDNWEIYSCDGECFGQDLVARSEHEKQLC